MQTISKQLPYNAKNSKQHANNCLTIPYKCIFSIIITIITIIITIITIIRPKICRKSAENSDEHLPKIRPKIGRTSAENSAENRPKIVSRFRPKII